MLTPCSHRRRSSAARCAGSVTVPTTAICVSPTFTSAWIGNGRFASCNASTPPTLPLPDSGVRLYVPLTVQPMAYGGTVRFVAGAAAPELAAAGTLAPGAVATAVVPDAAEAVVEAVAVAVADAPVIGTAPDAADAPDAVETLEAAEAAAASACEASRRAPCLPTTSADALRDASSCDFITSPIGIGCPSVSTTPCTSAFFCWSEYAKLPFAKAISCNSSFHSEGCADEANLNVQLLRPSMSRSKSTDGFTRLIAGITMSCATSGSPLTLKSISSRVPKSFSFVQSAVPI